MGLPWKSTEEDLRNYFQQMGDVLMVQVINRIECISYSAQLLSYSRQVKQDPKTKQSKGFGFVRFADYEVQKKVLGQRHLIDGRWCDVRIPNSKNFQDQQVPYGHGPPLHADWAGGHNNSAPPNWHGDSQMQRKVFIGRCTEDMTVDDLRTYFTKFGDVVDVFIPKPFRAFAFVTFSDAETAQALCGEDHIIKGASVHVSTAAPKSYDKVNKMQPPPGAAMGGAWNNAGQWGPGGRAPSNQGAGINQNIGMLNNPLGMLANPAMMAALGQASWGLLGMANQGGGGANQAGPGGDSGNQQSSFGAPPMTGSNGQGFGAGGGHNQGWNGNEAPSSPSQGGWGPPHKGWN